MHGLPPGAGRGPAAEPPPLIPGDIAAGDGDEVAPGWFARSQEPPRMPRGATFADAAAGPPTPPGGTPVPGTPPRGTPRPFGPGPYTPPHGTPGPVTAAGMHTASARAWTPIPPAPPVGSPAGPHPGPHGDRPGDPSAPQGGSGGHQMRLLAVITTIVVLLAAAVTVAVMQPWKDDNGANAADASGNPTGRTDPTGRPGPTTQPARPGDSGNPSGNTSASSGSSPPTSASPSASAPVGDARTQAAALSAMLDHSGASRQSVINAVNNASGCTALAGAASDLSRAADSRNAQLAELDTLKFDALPEAAPALEHLRTAWRESASADAHYAAWAQAQADSGCGAGQTSKDAGDAASGRATTAKQAFVAAWNGIAARYELPTRTELAI